MTFCIKANGEIYNTGVDGIDTGVTRPWVILIDNIGIPDIETNTGIRAAVAGAGTQPIWPRNERVEGGRVREAATHTTKSDARDA
jgi:hypothetical protein